MIVRGESTIIDYNAPFDQGFRSPAVYGRISACDPYFKIGLFWCNIRYIPDTFLY